MYREKRPAVLRKTVVLWALILVFAVPALAQTTEFTYQGSLKNGGVSANGSYDFIFVLFDSLTGGTQIGSQVIRNNVPVADGQFAVKLDFGSQFPGANRFMQILVRQQPNIHTQLEPRQQINSTPYAIKSLNAESAVTSTTATNALQLGGTAAGQYVLTGDARLSDARSPLAGSPSYIQNTTPGTGFSFSINGTGIANIVQATTQFNLNGQRILSNAGVGNFFAGGGTGAANTGTDNSFFGFSAGQNNSTGSFNSFFGKDAGTANLDGTQNSFFGSASGAVNTSGSFNSFFGRATGRQNTTGSRNSIFGDSAGFNNSTASNNSFYGWQSGFANTTGSENTFLGSRAGAANTTGALNTFVGGSSGQANTTGVQNSFFGTDAGSNNTVGKLNSFFGYQSGTGNTGDQNAFFGERTGIANSGFFNSFFGQGAGNGNTSGGTNTFIGWFAGTGNTVGGNNTFVGSLAGFTGGSGMTGGNTLVGADTRVNVGVSASAAIGFGATVTTSNTIILGRPTEKTFIPGNFSVFVGTSVAGVAPFSVGPSILPNGKTYISNLHVGNFNTLASPVHTCMRLAVEAPQGWMLAQCTASFARESQIEVTKPISAGLLGLLKLRPVEFRRKADGSLGFGVTADNVAAIIPEAASLNEQGEVEDISEGALDVIFINAIKEQQTQIALQNVQIEAQRQSLKQLQQQMDALKDLLCASSPNTVVCREQEK